MRAAIAITLIVCGTLLVALPPLSDFTLAQTEARLLADRGATSLTVAQRMSDRYRLGCFTLGGLMIGTAVVSSLATGRITNSTKASVHPAVA